jgi:hypothetical protein
MIFLRGLLLLICIYVILGAWGCFPEPTLDPDYKPSDESRMKEIDRRFEMLKNNQNW